MFIFIVFLITFTSTDLKTFHTETLPTQTLSDLANKELPVYEKYIQKNGYKIEYHYCQTEDGYINTIWHLLKQNAPKKNYTKIPVILQHGCMDTSWTFFQQIVPENNLPFLLIEDGYDVWLPNTRGNKFSLNHTTLEVSDTSDYWDFSMDEIALYDLPAFVNYVKNKTGFSKVNWIGNSQGNTIFYMNYLNDPSFIEKNINKFVSSATVPAIIHSHSPRFIILSKFIGIFQLIYPFGHLMLFPDFINKGLVKFCGDFPDVVQFLLESRGDQPTGQTIGYRICKFFNYFPGGASKNNLIQWMQIFNAKKVQKFDFGPIKNLEKYGKITPPEYIRDNYKGWNVKSLIAFGQYDNVAGKEDVWDFISRVENKDVIQMLMLENYNHADTLTGKNSRIDMFEPIIKFLNKA